MLSAITMLWGHQQLQIEHKVKMNGVYDDNEFVFTNDFGKHLEPRYLSEAFDDIRTETGITDLTIHSLRHTFTTRALEAGIDMKVLQDLLGHADFSVKANTYTHVLEDMKTESMRKVSGAITAIRKGD